jgi:hypothetical protein
VKGSDRQACSGHVAVQLGDKFVRDVQDQGNGVHIVRFEVPAGQRRLPIKVKVNKIEIPGSPFVLNVDCIESTGTQLPDTLDDDNAPVMRLDHGHAGPPLEPHPPPGPPPAPAAKGPPPPPAPAAKGPPPPPAPAAKAEADSVVSSVASAETAMPSSPPKQVAATPRLVVTVTPDSPASDAFVPPDARLRSDTDEGGASPRTPNTRLRSNTGEGNEAPRTPRPKWYRPTGKVPTQVSHPVLDHKIVRTLEGIISICVAGRVG